MHFLNGSIKFGPNDISNLKINIQTLKFFTSPITNMNCKSMNLTQTHTCKAIANRMRSITTSSLASSIVVRARDVNSSSKFFWTLSSSLQPK